MYSGEDAMVLPLLSFGGIGVISVIANIVPDLTHKMVSAWLSGDTQTAIRTQIELIPLIKAMFCEVNPIPVKAAMNMMGLEVGSCRMPLCDPSPEHQILIRSTLIQYGLIQN
jgi:4-hydroxy-tetrahydrodipicolinate synthase